MTIKELIEAKRKELNEVDKVREHMWAEVKRTEQVYNEAQALWMSHYSKRNRLIDQIAALEPIAAEMESVEVKG